MSLSDEEWQKAITDWMLSGGWVNDRNDEITLGFKFIDSEGNEWIRDYDKRSRSFVHYNGSQIVNLRVNKEYLDDKLHNY